MKSLPELEKIIIDFENEVNELKKINEITKLLSKTNDEIIKSNNNLNKGIESYNATIKQLNSVENKIGIAISDYEKKLNNIKDVIEKSTEENKSEITKTISELKQSIEFYKKEIKNLIEINEKFLKDLENSNTRLFEDSIEKLINSNKRFLKELEEILFSKLERFNSDIQVTITRERTLLQDALQLNISTQFNSLKEDQKALFEEQNKKIGLLRNLIFVNLILSILIIIAIMYFLTAFIQNTF